MTDNPYVQPAKPKDSPMGYILLFLLGIFGGHRFYLNRKGTAIAQLILTCTLYGLLVSIPWNIVDAFLIPRMVREENAKLAAEWDAKHVPVDDGGFA
jgi:TM2 domain-containing membrane protein YozV